MSLLDVKEDIIKDSKNQALKIEKEAKDKVDLMLKENLIKLKNNEKDKKAEFQKIVDVKTKREISQYKLQANKLILIKKKEILDEAFNKSTMKISKLSEVKRKKFLEHILKNVKKEIEINRIICNNDDEAIIKKLVEKNVKIESDKKINGGIICYNKDDSIMIDMSYNKILDNLKNQHLQTISQIIFNK